MSATREDEASVRGLGKAIRSLLRVTADLDEVKSLEQAKRNAETAASRARGDTKAAEESRRQALGELDAANEALGKSRHDAKQIIFKAQSDGLTAVRDAEAKAREIVDEAKNKAEVLNFTIQQNREAHTLFMRDVGRQHEKAQEEMDTLNMGLKVLREKVGL